MTAAALALLAVTDCMLAAFRAAAGRCGSINKRDYLVDMLKRALVWSLALLVANAAVAAVICFSAPDPATAWDVLAAAARPLIVIYGLFALSIALAFAFYFAPIGDFRVITNMIVFGPLTAARRLVIVGGLVYASAAADDWRVTVVAVIGGFSILAFEPLFGRRYAEQWRKLCAPTTR